MNHADSYACHLCFNDKTLIDSICKEGRQGGCDWCGARNVYVMPLHELGDIFRDLIRIYAQGDTNDDPISYLLQEDWNIFSDRIEQASDGLMQHLTIAILKAGLSPKDYSSGNYPDFDGFFHRKGEWLVEHWYEKAEAYFLGGQRDLQDALPSTTGRIAPDDDLPDQLEVAFEDLSSKYDPGHILYRSRIHKDRFRSQRFTLSEIGAPLPENARAGRANRKDVPVLYLADNAKTALAEVRAWNGMAVAIAKYEVKKPLSVVSFLNFQEPESPFDEEYLEWKMRLSELFERLADELSRPILPGEDETLYFSTQYLCDLVRKSPYDGIEYPSAMGPGYNVAIFNWENLEPLEIQYVRIDKIKYLFDPLDEDEPLYDEGPFDDLMRPPLP